MKHYKVNEKIRAKDVRLISDKGEQLGVMATDKARSLAKEKGLDLLLISETSSPPVCKLVDYGHFMYQQKKKDRQARRTVQVSKELKLSPKISENDYQVRLAAAKKFLAKRYKVKMTIFFRGREIVHQDLGMEVAKRFVKDITEFGNPENSFSRSGRTIVTTISPK